MKFTQCKTRWLTRLMLVVALFAQSILAAHACVAPDASAAHAVAMESVNEAMPCHESAKLNANECLMHCTASDQLSLDQHTMPAAPAEEIVLLVALPQIRHRVLTSSQPPLVLNTGPPLSIRFCSFLI
jgi:hypothetical protein